MFYHVYLPNLPPLDLFFLSPGSPVLGQVSQLVPNRGLTGAWSSGEAMICWYVDWYDFSQHKQHIYTIIYTKYMCYYYYYLLLLLLYLLYLYNVIYTYNIYIYYSGKELLRNILVRLAYHWNNVCDAPKMGLLVELALVHQTREPPKSYRNPIVDGWLRWSSRELVYWCSVGMIYWLVVWNIFLFFHILGIISLTDFHIFQRGRYTLGIPPTSILSLPEWESRATWVFVHTFLSFWITKRELLPGQHVPCVGACARWWTLGVEEDGTKDWSQMGGFWVFQFLQLSAFGRDFRIQAANRWQVKSPPVTSSRWMKPRMNETSNVVPRSVVQNIRHVQTISNQSRSSFPYKQCQTWKHKHGKFLENHPPSIHLPLRPQAAGGDLLHCLLDGGAFPEHQAGADGGWWENRNQEPDDFLMQPPVVFLVNEKHKRLLVNFPA